jgi:hypothetical protein
MFNLSAIDASLASKNISILCLYFKSLLINNPKYRNKIKLIDEDIVSKLWYVNNPFVVLNLPGINDLAWKPGDFIAHVVGYKAEDRVQIISDLNYFSKLHNGYREI